MCFYEQRTTVCTEPFKLSVLQLFYKVLLESQFSPRGLNDVADTYRSQLGLFTRVLQGLCAVGLMSAPWGSQTVGVSQCAGFRVLVVWIFLHKDFAAPLCLGSKLTQTNPRWSIPDPCTCVNTTNAAGITVVILDVGASDDVGTHGGSSFSAAAWDHELEKGPHEACKTLLTPTFPEEFSLKTLSPRA